MTDILNVLWLVFSITIFSFAGFNLYKDSREKKIQKWLHPKRNTTTTLLSALNPKMDQEYFNMLVIELIVRQHNSLEINDLMRWEPKDE